MQGEIVRTVTEAPPSQEARRRAGGRAYGVMGHLLRKAAEGIQSLRVAKIRVQWGSPLEVYVQDVEGLPRPSCIVTWRDGQWTARQAEITNIFGETLRPSEILAALSS